MCGITGRKRLAKPRGLAGAAGAVTNQPADFAFLCVELRCQFLQPIRRAVDGENRSHFVFRSGEDGTEPASVLDFKFRRQISPKFIEIK